MFKNIKSLIYEKNYSFSPIDYFEIDIDENKNIFKYTDTINTHKIENVDDQIVIGFFDSLFRIIDGWKNKYDDNSVIDGSEWKLQITYINGEKNLYYGKNGFPNNFEYLDKIKYEFINKVKENKIWIS